MATVDCCAVGSARNIAHALKKRPLFKGRAVEMWLPSLQKLKKLFRSCIPDKEGSCSRSC